MDARFNANELARRVEKVGRHRNRIDVSNMDAVNFIERWQSPNAEPTLLYLDPPYFTKGEGLYDNFYGRSDHATVAAAVRSLEKPWIVSYDAHPEIVELYRGCTTIRYALSYSAATRLQGPEVMFFSPGLVVPDRGPSGIPMRDVLQAQLNLI